jgi:tetratricopeptide (TPR) repeat protein
VPEYQRDLARTYTNLGAVLAGLGKIDEARTENEQARDLLKKLADAFPDVLNYQRGLAESHNNLGFLLARLGKSDEARKEYETARDLRKKLADASSGVPIYQVELAATHNNLGILLDDLGKRDEARKEYEQARDLRKRLADTFPGVPEYQIELGGSYCNLGRLLLAEGKPADSLKSFDLAVRTLTPVHEKEPRGVMARLFLRNSYWGRAKGYHQLKQYAESVKNWDRVIELSSKSEQPSFRAGRANSQAQAGQVAEAVAEIEELTKQSQDGTPDSPKWNANQWYDFACVCAVASGKLVDKKQEYADRAMRSLHQAVKAGYKNAAHMAKDADLDPLRDRDDFKKMLADLHARAGAGAKP